MHIQEKEIEMMKKNRNDYKRFSFIFLYLSTFLYIGSLLPFDDKSTLNTSYCMLASCLLLSVSLFFYTLMRRLEKKYKNL
ncbi:YrhC family protein [Pullulanibacillus sp. KACC 23026]|uniref:YrhC family protein n=1 Tax=Pullulanibacillus sp. KACC 23026 TaxID=3028315 RepID=UPI0023B0AEA6|nr:YrhC family protein [Pullulanibacillus sp. KACC 23026]WEG14107.1 YrhC family protein [Pullulanibacillus sp. KACC 23026]